MILERKIQYSLLTIFVIFIIFITDTLPVHSKSSTEFLDSEISDGVSINDVFATNNAVNFPTFPPDTNLTLKQLDSLRADSIRLGLIEIDTLMYDSTARINNFKYVRKESSFLGFDPKRKISLYAQPSQRVLRRTVQLDSTGSYVIIKQLIANNEMRNHLKIPLDDYIKMKLRSTERDSWKEQGYKYTLKEGKDDLGQLFSNITNIEIPLPSVSFLSIFGPPKISLKINGAVDIHGAWRNETTEGITTSLLGNTRNEPDFKQQVQINVSGTIGDKLTIAADWNTERTFEFENQLKLHYEGYEDEIIQSVEAGNVSLRTSPLVGGGEALFGIKAVFQLGPFSLTALASQKKSEVEEVSVSGGTQKSTFEKRAYEYSQNHYFVDLDYADENLNIFNDYFGNANPVINNEYKIKQIEVWKTTSGNLDISKQKWGNAYIDLPERISDGAPEAYDASLKSRDQDSEPGRSLIGYRFIPLTDGVDYTYNAYAGFISFRTQISNEDAIAIAYRVEGPDPGNTDKYYGEFLNEIGNDTSAVIILKLIKPQKLQPGGAFSDAWKLQLKNIYPIGGRDVKKEGFTFDIRYQVPGAEPVNNFEGENFLEQFGLDTRDETGAGSPDGALDWDPGITILPKTGEIIFPVLQPFGKDFPFDEELKYQAIYDTSLTFAKQDKTQDKFIMVGEYSADASSVYNIGFNVVENSVKVTLNGGTLQIGSDYSVDYNIGQVVIRNADALVPGANLRITYEKNDLFQLASKTLLGLRGIYDVNEKTKLGFSYLNLNQTTLSDKVRIGEEPLNNSIFGLDFQTGLDIPFITKGLNNVISTKAMSSLNLKGEFAYMSPDPNTKKSNITGDEKKSIAYIDDFEGAKRTIPIGVSYTGWRDISVPRQMFGISGLDKLEQMNYKAKSNWFNNRRVRVRVSDIWGDRKQVSKRDDQITVLDYYFNPEVRGTYNYSPQLDDKMQNWGGIMHPLSSTASNLVEENIQFVEFWIKIEQAPEGAKIMMDLGQISEDIIPNNFLNNEDKNQNDKLDEGEDVGLDGFTNAQEKIQFPLLADEADPSDDNFSYSIGSLDYSKINGTEGNGALSEGGGRIPDSEDMNKNFTLDNVDSYFRYEIPLDTNTLTNEFISGGGSSSGWYQFRIPLQDAIDSIGSPSFTIVEVIRFWIAGVEEPVHLRFAEMNLVGNQWQKVLIPGQVEEDDTTLVIATINIEDNPEYASPPGLKQERDRTNTEEVIFKNEQSLKLTVNELEDGDNREIVKYLYRPLDVFNYKTMKLFIHGDNNNNLGSISYYGGAQDFGSEVYFRFGTDTSNFYEYRQPVQSDWNEIEILFEELTAIKQARETEIEYYTTSVPGKEGHFYGVKGKPTLTKVNFFSFGIRNPANVGIEGEAVSGELWVNELRVLGADDTPGWAYSASSQMKFADLLSVSVNTSKTDPYFHKLSQRFGKRVDNNKWNGSVNFNFLKLLPWNLQGSSLSLSYSHSESVSKPLYLPGTDINVSEAVIQEKQKLIDNGHTDAEATAISKKISTNAQSVNISDSWALSSIKIKIPSKKWYIDDIINNLQFSFNFNKSYSRSPSIVFANSWAWNGSGKYSLNFSKENYFFVADIPLVGNVLELFEDYKNVKFYFTPQTFNTGINSSRKNSSSLSRSENSKLNTQRDFSAKRNFSFNWKFTEGGFLNLSLNYNVNVSSSYAHLLAVDNISRSESDIWNDIFNGSIFGRDYNYTQSFDVKTKPKLPSLWNLSKYFTLTMGYNVNYKWANNFKQEALGRSIGYSNSLRASVTLKLKSLVAPLFKESSSKKKGSNKNSRKPKNNRVKNIDEKLEEGRKDKENKKNDVKEEPGEPIYVKALSLLKLGSKWLFFDYENISMNISQTNSANGGGIRSEGTGFSNFWGFYNQKKNGASRLFMLGLSNDIGERAPNGNLTDSYSQKNTIDFKTSRPLWEGAKVSINWKVGWGYNKTTRISTDDDGTMMITDATSSGNLNRSFMFLPISFSKAGIVRVNEIYQNDPNKNIANAFVGGFESFPILSKFPIFKDVVKYIPRANWRFDWRGLEKISFLKGLAQSISLNHAYTSAYSEGWKVDPDGNKQVQTQRINYGFAPLAGLNITFDKLWGGKLRGSLKYSTKTSFDLGIVTKNVTESFSKDINITANFAKSGFSLPLFGLNLKNDIEVSLSYTSAQNSIVIFEMENFKEKGKPQDGTTRTVIEPRIKYTLSSKVNLSVFYKRTSVEPEGASRIPATTTNEAGLDVHITIQ